MKKFFLGLSAALAVMSCENTSGIEKASDIEITDGVMTPEVLLSLGRLSDPRMSPDGCRILYGVSWNDIAANSSCRNLWLCDADGENHVQLTRYAKSVSNARWSLDGKWIYFLQEGQLWKAPLKGNKLGKKVQLSDVPAGISEFKLSPDQNSVIYLSTVKNPKLEQPEDSDPALDKAQAYATEDLMYRHWDHWVTERPRSYVAALNGEKITPGRSIDILGDEPYELPAEPFGGAEQLDWSPDGRYIAYSCRKLNGKQYAFSTNTGIYVYDLLTGETVPVKADGGYDTDPVWSPDGGHLAWISMARDGYEADAQRIMVASVNSAQEAEGQSFGLFFGPARQLAASLDRDASGLAWFGDNLYFNALIDGVQAIFKLSLQDELTRLTPPDWANDFFTPFAIDGEGENQRLLTTVYSLHEPLEMAEVFPVKHDFGKLSFVNAGVFRRLDSVTTESVFVPTVDGKQMQCWVMYPPKFDESKTYPAIEIVLGGPQGTNSQDWSYRWCYRLMAQQGYIVIMPNRRGTTAFGQDWKEQISGDYCGLNMQDYLSAGRYIKSKPYVGKLACVGASYGGYSAYMLEGLHGDLYDCFIAHAGIFDEAQLWFTTEEMWFANWDNGGLTEYAYSEGQQGPAGDGITFGGMQQAGAPYASTPKARRHYANSPSSMVTKWHTPILCIHGMMDYRIPYEQGMAAFNAAQMMGVPSKLVVFPEENHWILQPQNALYWHRTFFDWLDRWIK
ncbi:MAG: S9 family peptidase [Bacteroidales bacterium]|nr:S9 family peptidase [Bacteroidales bacterium]